MSKSYGLMCVIDQAVAYIQSLPENPRNEQIIHRLEYHRAQAEGVKPKYNKGKYIKDWYRCGNCAFSSLHVEYDYCPNCGFRIKWDSPRCLTK